MTWWRWLLVAAVLAVPVAAQEVLNLGKPANPDPGTSNMRVLEIIIRHGVPPGNATPTAPDVVTPYMAFFDITFAETTADGKTINPNKTFKCTYVGQQAEQMARTLNTANLSTNSLERRLMNRCTQDGKIGTGTVSGAPIPPDPTTTTTTTIPAELLKKKPGAPR
jgi:hypothetical protein